MNFTLPSNFNIFLQIALIAVVIATFVIYYILLYRRSFPRNKSRDRFDDLYKKLSDEIKYAVSPKFIELSTGVSELVELAVEIWRMEQRLLKCFPTLPENHRKGLEISLEKLKRYLSRYDVEILDYTNQKFNDGLNLDVLSVEKDPSLTSSIVKETIEPTVMLKGQVVRKAKIILLSNQ